MKNEELQTEEPKYLTVATIDEETGEYKWLDLVPVVRCKDCTHFMPIEQKGWGRCEICLNLYYSHRLVESKDYCSSAEPKQR